VNDRRPSRRPAPEREPVDRSADHPLDRARDHISVDPHLLADEGSEIVHHLVDVPVEHVRGRQRRAHGADREHPTQHDPRQDQPPSQQATRRQNPQAFGHGATPLWTHHQANCRAASRIPDERSANYVGSSSAFDYAEAQDPTGGSCTTPAAGLVTVLKRGAATHGPCNQGLRHERFRPEREHYSFTAR
jgi:hypothetical protein